MSDAPTIHRAMIAAVEAKDFDALRALYHADYVYAGADGAEHKGADAGVTVARTYTTAFPDLRLEILRTYTPNDTTSIIEFVGHGTHTGPLEDIAPTGRHIDVPVCNIIEVRDGLIVREREYFDTQTMLTQLGLAD